jgi:hypothetical protein
MNKVTFSPAALTRVLRAANRYGNKLVLRVGRFNDVCLWMTADEHYRRALHVNLNRNAF